MFWIIKIFATTLGETGGDAVTMTLNLGYAVGSLIFLAFFAVTLAMQVGAKKYHPFYYWAVVVATTTVGTTMSDYLDRTLGLGYVWSSIILFVGVLVIAFHLAHAPSAKSNLKILLRESEEIFYWVTILVSNTLGTALGDFVADDTGVGFQIGALIFGSLIVIVAALHYFTSISDSILFWAAYVLTRPLGATLGDTLTKPNGGFGLSRIASSLVIAVVMIVMIYFTYRTTF